jgi:hypothetical protein
MYLPIDWKDSYIIMIRYVVFPQPLRPSGCGWTCKPEVTVTMPGRVDFSFSVFLFRGELNNLVWTIKYLSKKICKYPYSRS